MHLTFAIPGIERILIDESFNRESRILHLQRMATRGTARLCPYEFYDFLAIEAGLTDQTELPLAMATSLQEGLPINEGYWLRADPIQLQASSHGVYCLGNNSLNLAKNEAEAFIKTLNVFLANDAIQFYLGADNTSWYMQIPEPKKLRLVPLESVIGKDLREYLPQDEDAGLLEGLLSEIQMLLYPHEINQKRRDQGLPTVDGLWVYGNGNHLLAWPWQYTFSDDNAVCALAQLSGMKSATVPKHINEVFNVSANSILLVYNELQRALQQSDRSMFELAMHNLEQHWLVPLYKALKQKKITQLNLKIAGRVYQLEAKHLYHFWRRTKSLAEVIC